MRRLATAGQLVRERDGAGAWRYDPGTVEAYAAQLREQQPAEGREGVPERGRHQQLSPGEIAALVGRALEQGLSPRDIAIQHELDPVAVGRTLEQLGALDQLMLDGPGIAERLEESERELAEHRQALSAVLQRLRRLERGQAIVAALAGARP